MLNLLLKGYLIVIPISGLLYYYFKVYEATFANHLFISLFIVYAALFLKSASRNYIIGVLILLSTGLLSTLYQVITESNFDKVIVTSDDDEILDISEQFDSEIIKRPAELASDTSTSFDAIKHTIDNVDKYDYVVLLQPTSPLRTAEQIDDAIELLEKKKADAVVSVCEMDHSPLWSNTLPDDGNMDNFLRDEVKNSRSQDLKKYYRLNGAIYICKTDNLLDEKSFFIKNNIFAYYMNRKSSIDIDEEFDFKISEVLIKDVI